jgi:hypothetical protein
MVIYPFFPVLLFTKYNITQPNKAEEIDDMYETHKGKIGTVIRNLMAKDFTRCEDVEWIRQALCINKSQTLQV